MKAYTNESTAGADASVEACPKLYDLKILDLLYIVALDLVHLFFYYGKRIPKVQSP